MVVCKQRGCQKSVCWPSRMYCSKHALAEEFPSSKEVAAPLKLQPIKQVGYFCQFIFKNEEAMRSITGIVEGEMKHMKLDTGYREFSDLFQSVAIEPFLHFWSWLLNRPENKFHFHWKRTQEYRKFWWLWLHQMVAVQIRGPRDSSIVTLPVLKSQEFTLFCCVLMQ